MDELFVENHCSMLLRGYIQKINLCQKASELYCWSLEVCHVGLTDANFKYLAVEDANMWRDASIKNNILVTQKTKFGWDRRREKIFFIDIMVKQKIKDFFLNFFKLFKDQIKERE